MLRGRQKQREEIRQRCRERQAAEDKSWWGFRRARGVTPARIRGLVRAGKGPGQVWGPYRD